MDLTPYVSQLSAELAVAAEAGGDDARALAERLTAPLDWAVRLMLLDALSSAADEITRDLAPGSVELRLRGREPNFIVTPPPADDSFVDSAPPATVAPPPGKSVEVSAMSPLTIAGRCPAEPRAGLPARNSA